MKIDDIQPDFDAVIDADSDVDIDAGFDDQHCDKEQPPRSYGSLCWFRKSLEQRGRQNLHWIELSAKN